MTYTLEIRLEGLPPMNAGHKHWRLAGEDRKVWRQNAAWAAKVGKPSEPLARCSITCTRHSPTEPDYDNLVISFKSIIDGLKDAGVIVDDKSSCIVERKYLWEKAPPKKGFVTVRVEER